MAISRANIPRELRGGRKVIKKKSGGKLGSGSRFKALSSKIQKSGKSKKSADAIAASIGRNKYGAKKMAKLSAKGRKRKRK
jgi:hypothetical protein